MNHSIYCSHELPGIESDYLQVIIFIAGVMKLFNRATGKFANARNAEHPGSL
jgi:hypothetical protein